MAENENPKQDSPIDIKAIENAVREKVESEFTKKFREITGFESFEKYQKHKEEEQSRIFTDFVFKLIFFS